MFTYARPIWAHHSREKLPEGEMNNTLCFKTVLPAGEYTALVAAADVYQLFVNGRFAAAGPARAAHAFARCDRLNFVLEEEGPVVFIVSSYNVFNYCYIKQPGFFCCEIYSGELLAAATGARNTGASGGASEDVSRGALAGASKDASGISGGASGGVPGDASGDISGDVSSGVQRDASGDISGGAWGAECEKGTAYVNGEAYEKGAAGADIPVGARAFSARLLEERAHRIDRYSYQRPYAEAYHYSPAWSEYMRSCENDGGLELFETGLPALLERGTPYPDYAAHAPVRFISQGRGEVNPEGADMSQDYFMIQTPDIPFESFGTNLEERPCGEIRRMKFQIEKELDAPFGDFSLKAGSFLSCEMDRNYTGFICCDIECPQKSVISFLFDEILTNGDIDPLRLGCVNNLKLTLEAGRYCFVSMEPYTFKYLKTAVFEGECLVKGLHLKEYAFRAAEIKRSLSLSGGLKAIYDAAVETFRQNTLDVYMDCPSRERGGWLCDSFFTSRVEYLLTGASRVEKAFLENFILPEGFRDVPSGMLPMCYPSDHLNRRFIPNWAIFFVLELREYLERTNDTALVRRAAPRLEGLLEYFKGYENEEGLLENLDGWIFVEWSRANDEELVRGINYPSNMLYARMLEDASYLLERPELLRRALRLRRLIRLRAYNGLFFRDNAQSEECTEVCQYYAFFTGVADRESCPELYNTLKTKFGPGRRENNSYPEVAFANAFIGNYLRLEMLSENNEREQVLRELEGYFLGMAQRTGTLWEHDSPQASCNHGFASHVLYWLFKFC